MWRYATNLSGYKLALILNKEKAIDVKILRTYFSNGTDYYAVIFKIPLDK